MREENEVLWPLPPILTLELWILAQPMLTGSRASRRDGLDVLHIGAQPSAWPGFDVELVGFVEVRGALREGDVERRLAGQRPR